MELSQPAAKLELGLLNARAQGLDRLDVITRFTNAGLPPEVVYRLEELWDDTTVIAAEVIHAGKIVLLEITRFVEENPNLAVGVAIGAAVGALISMIPGLGPLLAPLAFALGILVVAIPGFEADQGRTAKSGPMQIAQDVIAIARKFFELLVAILSALKSEYAGRVHGAQ